MVCIKYFAFEFPAKYIYVIIILQEKKTGRHFWKHAEFCGLARPHWFVIPHLVLQYQNYSYHKQPEHRPPLQMYQYVLTNTMNTCISLNRNWGIGWKMLHEYSSQEPLATYHECKAEEREGAKQGGRVSWVQMKNGNLIRISFSLLARDFIKGSC